MAVLKKKKNQETLKKKTPRASFLNIYSFTAIKAALVSGMGQQAGALSDLIWTSRTLMAERVDASTLLLWHAHIHVACT